MVYINCCPTDDLCDSSPCQNGGTCQDGGPPSSESSLPMYCQCAEKFSGRFCAVPKDSADCQTALGMENYGIPNERVQASSEWKFDKAIHGRLHFQSRSGNQGAWSAKTKDANQWLQIDLGSVFTKVTGVATQGRYMYDQWVTKYKVQFSNGGSTFTNYKEPGQAADKVFDGNTDQNTVVKHFLHAPFRARYIRFQPVTYYERISMRVELYGCSDFVCQSPDVILPNISPNASSNISIHRLRQFTIQSDVKFNCNIYYKASFLWRIYQLGKEETLLLSRNSFSELQITPHLLPVGEFLVRLNVSLIGTAVFGVGHGYFKVERSPLVAFIAGGNKVAKGLDRTLIFDASLSYDPDEKSLRFSGLNFTWQCKESPRHLNNSDEPGCHYRADDKETVGYELRINNSLLAENTSYFITVQVTKHERQAVYTQEVFIVPGDPPEVQIRCVENCAAKLNPSGIMALQGMCTGASCHGNLIFEWTALKDLNNSSKSSHWAEISHIQELISTRVSSKSFVTRPEVLTPDTRYKFILTAQRPGGNRGFSEYHVTSNSPPVGGVCNVSQTSGVTLITEFTFACNNWQDPDLQLQYEFIYLIDDNIFNVAYKGVKKSLTTKLPAGGRKNNFTIDFRVRVADILGAYTEVRTPVQVSEPTFEPKDLVDMVASLTSRDESELNSLIKSGDVSRAAQLATAVLSVVDVVTQAESAESQVQELKEKKIMMKSNIIQQLSAVPVDTVVRVQQVSYVIASASSVIGEITVEAQKAATEALEKMTVVLKTESTAGQSYDTLFDGAKSLVTGLGSMLRVTSHEASVDDAASKEESRLKASFITAYEGRLPKSQRRNLKSRISLSDVLTRTKRDGADLRLQARVKVETLLHSLEEVGSTILSRTLVGEEPKVLPAQAMSLLLLRQEPNLVAGTVLSNKGNSFRLPPVSKLFDNSTQFLDSQMVTTDFIPFSWDPSGARVTTAVSSLELKNSSGHLLNTTELIAPITLRLQSHQKFTNASQFHYVGSNRTVFYKVNVNQSGMALLLNIRPESNKTEFVVTVKYGERPSPSNSDLNLTLPDLSSCNKVPDGYVNCSSNPYVVFVNQDFVENKGFGYYFFGLRAVSRISRVKRCSGHGRSKRSCVQYKEPPTMGPSYSVPQYRVGDENYTIQVMPAACLFWNAELSKWTSEGCQVAEMTTQDAIYCSCNHLSSFGGQLFVTPNPLDFDKVFIELTRLPDSGNIAVILAVSCVFGLYLSLLLWARKNDKLDNLKVGEKAFVGVPSEGSHFIEVQVSTGIWRNSGTTANVFVILEGEIGTSRPYHLKDDSSIPFARGSIISFILAIHDSIGPIRTVRVWHDNSGNSPSWFLNHIKVCELTNKKQWNFVCFAWLAVDRGDGLIDRTLRGTSTVDKGIDFAVYVQNRIAGEFSDSHLWFSVATRPPRYRFTRAQRLSCCLSLLLTTMLASAMFYERETAMDDNQGSLRLGRFVVNFREFIIAVQSLMVVLPVNILTVALFTHTRSSNENKEMALQSNSHKKLARKSDISFPHWFIFVPWLLCFLLSTCTASFVVFYSLQWGADKSEQWLVSVAMSVVLDIFVSKPVQIIVVAFMLSHICKGGIQRFTRQPYHADAIVDVEDIKLSWLGNEDTDEEEIEIPKPLSKRQLRRARIARMREVYMYTALRNIVSYMLYLLILFIVCYGGRSQHGYLMTSTLKTTFGKLDSITNYFKTWDWARDVLVPGLFDDGKNLILNSHSLYIGSGDAVLVGMPRFRQLRVKEGSCDVSIEELKPPFNSCVATYTSNNEDKSSFHRTRWDQFSSSRNDSLNILYQICPTAWHYSSAERTQSLPLWGKLHLSNFYGEGGYLAELGYDKATALKVISELKLFDWIDRFTSAIIVEFTVFNSQVNLFGVIWIPIEFSPSGHVVSDPVIRGIHVYEIGGGYSAVTVVCQLLLVVYIIYFVVKETSKMIAGVRMYFAQFLNWVELTQTLTVIGFVVTHIFKQAELFYNTEKLRNNTFQFISFDKGAFLEDLETVLISLLMFLNTLKLLYLLKFNPHVRHLFYVMKGSARELVNCSVAFTLFMFACIHVGYFLFGSELYPFSSPVITLQSLLVEGVLGGRFDYFNDCCTVTGPVYVTALKLGLNLIFINVFVSVLVYNYGNIRDLTRGKFNLGNFIIVKIKELMGFGVHSSAMDADSSCDPNTKNEENALPEVDEILTKLDRINHHLNVLYADEFGEDLDMFSLWFDLHMQRLEAKDTQRNENDAEKDLEDA
ncbi:polycystic kidney disease protein 1-like 2 isoform X2 [Stylophora pistillata]|uniref:polycystic kidney disease protein 1-like 2 isoform X2 n=1 Tax=Stylophora pistillata TaxID=50429 RepID=UPI000C050055|nr:polycystic kidney disease protein 1-like 2 isoform X2 [Stylophora pistillata]